MENSCNKDLVKRIDELLEQHNLNRSQFLKICKINGGFLNNLEKKTLSPSLDKIICIANYFNVSLDYLVFGKNSTNPVSDETDKTAKIETAKVNTDEQELLKIYRYLDRRGKIRVNNFIYDEIEDIKRSGDIPRTQGFTRNY